MQTPNLQHLLLAISSIEHRRSLFDIQAILSLISLSFEVKKYDVGIELINIHKMWNNNIEQQIIDNSIIEVFPVIFKGDKLCVQQDDGFNFISTSEENKINITKQLTTEYSSDFQVSVSCIISSIKYGHFKFLDLIDQTVKPIKSYFEDLHTHSPFDSFMYKDIKHLKYAIDRYNFKPTVYDVMEVWGYHGECNLMIFLSSFITLKDIETNYMDELTTDDCELALYNYMKHLKFNVIQIQRWVRPIIWKPYGRLATKLYYDSDFSI